MTNRASKRGLEAGTEFAVQIQNVGTWTCSARQFESAMRMHLPASVADLRAKIDNQADDDLDAGACRFAAEALDTVPELLVVLAELEFQS